MTYYSENGSVSFFKWKSHWNIQISYTFLLNAKFAVIFKRMSQLSAEHKMYGTSTLDWLWQHKRFARLFPGADKVDFWLSRFVCDFDSSLVHWIYGIRFESYLSFRVGTAYNYTRNDASRIRVRLQFFHTIRANVSIMLSLIIRAH